jgi:hypothetical protein
MKKNLFIYSIFSILLFSLNSSCIDESLRTDIDELKDDNVILQNEIELLKQSITVNFIESLNNSYKIHFSDDSAIVISNGLDGQDSPYIIEIAENNTHYIFKFSDKTIIEAEKNLDFKRIACWGDSLTAQGFPAYLQEQLSSIEYGVLNLGVGGESSRTIGARQGGIPMYLKEQIEIPESTDTIVIGDINNSFVSSENKYYAVKPLLRGNNTSVNNCVINDIECVINWTGLTYNDPDGRYTLSRIESGIARLTTENSIVFTGGMRNFRNFYANIFFVGQNGGYDGYESLTNQIRKMVDFSSSSNYLVIGLHTESKSSREGLELLMKNEFGARYINLREYLSTYGLEDAGLTPTEEDLSAIEKGICPPQLLGNGIHFTDIGSNLLAKLVHRRLVFLGITE